MTVANGMKAVLMLGALACLGACATGPAGPSRGPSENYAADSLLGEALPSSDVREMARAFLAAMESGAAGARFDWRGPASFGWVKPGALILGNVKASPYDRPEYPAGLYLDDALETELGLYAVVRDGNVRGGPSTDFQIIDKMRSGDAVEVVGKVVGRPWYLVERDGRIRGYMYETLLRKGPGFELELAGGPTRRPVQCRRFEQRVSYTGRSDRWDGAACRSNGRWVLVPGNPNKPQKLY